MLSTEEAEPWISLIRNARLVWSFSELGIFKEERQRNADAAGNVSRYPANSITSTFASIKDGLFPLRALVDGAHRQRGIKKMKTGQLL